MEQDRERSISEREADLRNREEEVLLRERLVQARERALALAVPRELLQEANEQLVLAALRSQEAAETEGRAKERAQSTTRDLETTATLRERLIGIIGHDLRTPISSIMLSARLLLGGGSPASHTRDVERILASAKRMQEMVDQLFDLTRARLGGGLPVHVEPMDLAAVIRAVVDELRSAYPGHAIEVDAPVVEGQWDAGRMAQVVSNLVGNALQHGPADATVRVALRQEGDVASFDVQNRGNPIPADLLPNLFQPFRRGNGETHHAGLGLGLFITREIVLAHGGDIDVASNEERTVFSVTVPRFPSRC